MFKIPFKWKSNGQDRNHDTTHLAGKEAETRSWSRQGTDRRPANFLSKKKRQKGKDLLHAAHPLHRGGRLLWPAAPDQVDLALGLLLLHPVEEGEEEIGVGGRDRSLRPTVIQGRLGILSCYLVGDKVRASKKRDLEITLLYKVSCATERGMYDARLSVVLS